MRKLTISLAILAMLLTPITLPSLDQNGTLQPISLIVKPAQGQAAGIKSFVIIVSKDGLNGTESAKLSIVVNEGDRVKITFIMAEEDRKNKDPLNRHIMEITGYDIMADEINPSNPEATLVFLADKPGSFKITCSPDTWDCPGHDLLQDGKFEVNRAGVAAPPPQPAPAPAPQPAPAPAPAPAPQPPPPAPAPAPQPAPQPVPAQPPAPLKTSLNLDAKDYCDGVCSIFLIGTLTDNEGNPIEGMPIAFTVNTTFGTLRIASLYTNKQGTALANYSAGSIGMYEFAASFSGGGGYGASKFLVTRHILYAGSEPTESLFAPRNVAVGIAIGAVLSVWGAYAFVLGQLGGIFRERKKHQGGDNRQAS